MFPGPHLNVLANRARSMHGKWTIFDGETRTHPDAPYISYLGHRNGIKGGDQTQHPSGKDEPLHDWCLPLGVNLSAPLERPDRHRVSIKPCIPATFTLIVLTPILGASEVSGV